MLRNIYSSKVFAIWLVSESFSDENNTIIINFCLFLSIPTFFRKLFQAIYFSDANQTYLSEERREISKELFRGRDRCDISDEIKNHP